jgi:site-specific DNA-methyltransferase (adenine-specific)
VCPASTSGARPCAFHRLTCAIEDAGWEIRDCLSWLYGSGFPKSHNGPWGGTALKPAWEPATLARKPLIGTVAANHAAHGTGALNVDGCRIEGAKRTPGYATERKAGGEEWSSAYSPRGHTEVDVTDGRWPANVCLDEEAASALDEQSGNRPGATSNSAPATSRGFTRGAAGIGLRAGYADSGGASRFFYVAKASKRERGEGNTHPTVKPIALMRWVARLVTPAGGIVLDPFAGSGTTGLAAHAEGMRAVLVEREAEYVEIIRRRIANAEPDQLEIA